MTEPEPADVDPIALMRSKQFLGLLGFVSVVGLISALLAWCFLELVAELQQGVFDDLPDALGFEKAPIWWPLPVLAIGGVIVAFAVARLPGNGGHIPAEGLKASPTSPIELPGVMLAAVVGIGLGAVLGPEAPLIALGGGLGLWAVSRLRADVPAEVGTLVATSGIFAALSFLFGSPVIAAVILIEAAGIGGKRLPLVLIPGLLAAGIGTLVSIGMGSWTGVNTTAISLDPIPLPDFARPDLADFLWTVPFAAVIAVGTFVIFRIGREAQVRATPRPFLMIPAAAIAIAALAMAFEALTDKGFDQVLFSGQEALNPLVANAGTWSLGALALLILFKGIAYGLALGTFRGGPTFPAMFLGAAAGVMAAELPGFDLAPAVAVGIGAAVVAVLQLPLSAVVLATVLTTSGGLGTGPVIIVGVAVAYLTTIWLRRPSDDVGDAAPA